MSYINKYKHIGAFVTGLLLGVGAVAYYQMQYVADDTYYDDKVHVHSDILVYVGDERIRFTDPKYQSSAEQILHKNFHFHDGDDEVLHRHAADLTLVEFFSSLDITLTDDCLILDDDREFCSDEVEKLQLYVNGEVLDDVTGYVPQEADQILLYVGDPQNPNIAQYLEGITDRACIFSGTCPERGTPPPESCGLTCEI